MEERRHLSIYFRLHSYQFFVFLHSEMFFYTHGPDPISMVFQGRMMCLIYLPLFLLSQMESAVSSIHVY